MSTVARPSKGPSQKKKFVCTKRKCPFIGMAGRRGGGGGRVKAQFPCIFAGDLETPWYIGECRATSCLSCCSTLSKQFPRFHSNYTANVVFQGQDMHAFFIWHHEQARNVRKSFRRYRSSWQKKYIWVARGIELYPQNGGQAAVVDAWAVHGIWWIILIQSRDLAMIARWHQCGTMTSQILARASFPPSVWPSSRSNFDLGPSPSDSTEKTLSYQSLWFWSAVFL